MAITNLLGPSRRSKNAGKGFFDPKNDFLIEGTGITLSVVDPSTESYRGIEQDNVPWGSDVKRVVKIEADLSGLDTGGLVTDSGLTTILADYATTSDLGDVEALIPTVSGYTGEVTVSGAVFTIENGLITGVA